VGWLAARGIGKLATRWFKPASTHLLSASCWQLCSLYFNLGCERVSVPEKFQDQLDVVVGQALFVAHLPCVNIGDAIVPVTLHLQNSSKFCISGASPVWAFSARNPAACRHDEALDRDPPKLVTLSRESFPDWSQPVYEWLYRRYTRR